MSVREYLDFCARIQGVPRGERKARIGTVMERTRVADMADRQCGKLSKGYRQRVGLAQALIHNPEVLILDEPTAGLDPKQINETRQLIKELRGDHTVVLSTHILPEVSQTCTRVVIINKGKVVAVDTPDNLTSRLRGSETMYVQLDPMGADAAGVLAGIDGVTRVSASTEARGGTLGLEVESEAGRDIRRELAAAIVNRGWGLLELRPLRMSLEDVFLKLTTQESDAPAESAEPAAEPPAAAAPAGDVEVDRE
jgi:ABC-2 type transport system ATP-binding protein